MGQTFVFPHLLESKLPRDLPLPLHNAPKAEIPKSNYCYIEFTYDIPTYVN